MIPENYHTIMERCHGYRINIDTICPIERRMLSGVYDPGSTTLIKKNLHAGDTVIDVGANIGALTFLFARLGCYTVAVEPGPRLLARLQANVRLNPGVTESVQIVNAGLAESVGKFYWKEDEGNRGNACLLNDEGCEVPVTT